MGCDVHGVVEVFIDGDWTMALSINDLSPRNYDLFGTFFGVRGYAEYDYKHRGFPQNMSSYSKGHFCRECDGNGHREATLEMQDIFKKYPPESYDYTGKHCAHCVDWHSVSWITYQELEAHWDEAIRIVGGQYKQVEWIFVFDTMKFWEMYLKEHNKIIESRALPSTGQEDTSRVRMIVWFDN